MRIVKEHEERKNEILDTAEILFEEKGYDKCSVNDILNRIGIAKGTFYHYFKSKEELLDALIERISAQMIRRAKVVCNKPEFTPEDKILQVFLCLKASSGEEKMIPEFHKKQNALLHQKSLQVLIRGITPVLVSVIEEGVQKGIFVCEYPEQYVQIFICSASVLLDEGMFELEKEKQKNLFIALITMLEKMLGLKEGKLLDRALKEYWER